MPNNVRDGRAVCPFYETSAKNRIRCECVIGGARLHHVFPTAQDAEEYLARFCCTYEYVACRYCALLCEMYEGSEEDVEH
jgi:hypothetical protein